MSDEAAWPTLVFLAIAVALLSTPRLFRFVDTAPVAHQHRLGALDGLRGVLASAVFFHHYFMATYNPRHGIAGQPSVQFYEFLGPAAVSMFFMMTGYLFWSKVLSRQGMLAWGPLFVNRLFRIYPLYLALILYYFAYAVRHIDLTPGQPLSETARQALLWLAFGAVDNKPAFLGQPGFLGLVGQTWTLSYEWMFYLALPLLAVFARHASCAVVVASALALAVLHQGFLAWPANDLAANLLIGMAIAHLMVARPGTDLRSPLLSVIVLLTLAVAVVTFAQPYSFWTSALCGLMFLIVTCGNTLFGVLTTAGAKRLGNISYSIYLLHGVVINALSTLPRYHANMYSDGIRYWSTFALTYVVVIALSIASYWIIELNGIAIGRRVETWLRRKRLAGDAESAVPRGSAEAGAARGAGR